uniref:ESF1 RRM domain-containing protein n=1 Tax=Lygus hesperus TaxID=30085 RepID=A0A0A9XFR9_LYGHE
MDDPLKDKRFSHVVSDPRFRKLPRSERKVKIDHRFKAMFTDDKFKLKYAVDKRGRPVEQTQADNLKKYYELTSGSEEGSDDEEAEESNEEADEESQEIQDNSGDDDDDSGDEIQNSTEEITDQLKPEVISKSVEKENHAKVEDERENELESNSAHQPFTSEVTSTKSAKKDQLKERSKMVDSVHKGRMKEVVSERLKDLTVDYARGIGTLGSDESSSDESTSGDSEEEEIFHPWGELANDAEHTEDATARLAACNLDWDRITAKDLFVLFTSFLPPEGFIKEVTIYPSEYGLQRMKEEELKGPKELFEDPKFKKFDDDDFTDKHAEGSQYCMEKLREYQLNRLRYYYAVITFNSPETANKIYTECDGIEYESSATKMDLRFIPDDMDFDVEPKESCTSMPDITKYKPRLFVNSALQQGTVRLTWDETDLNRVEFTKKLAGGEKINDDDLQAYIAASSDSSEDDKSEVENEDDVVSKSDIADNPIEKYKALLSSVTSNKKHKSNVDMEVSWGIGLGEKDSESEPEDSDAGETNDEKMHKGKQKIKTRYLASQT